MQGARPHVNQQRQNSSQKQWNKIGKLVGELDVTDFNMGKDRIMLKTLLPQYWLLLPLTIHVPTVMKGLSITRRWGR